MKYDKLEMMIQFMGRSQRVAIYEGLKGEERVYFADKITECANRIATMPATYEQDGMGNQAIAYLHYFMGAWDWWITEKDVDSDGEGQQQAFGLTRGHDLEMGYISIAELIANGAELDLHFEPKTLAELKARG